eukprot:UN16567
MWRKNRLKICREKLVLQSALNSNVNYDSIFSGK